MGNSLQGSSPLKPTSLLLPTLVQRYQQADAGTQFDVWRRVRIWALDLERELRDFHAQMRQQVPVLRCAECVGEAMWKSEGRAIDLARKELAGLDLTVVWPVIWAVAKDVGIYLGGGIVLGGVVGGAIGAFVGGAGAVPGVIGGATAGAEIGSWLLGLLGIKCLVEHIGKALPEMADNYSRGFAYAWHAGELDERRSMDVGRQMQSAVLGFARGHLLLVTAILSAIVLYLSRGALSRAKLYAELGSSKLGPKFAKWVEENEAKLIKHPALQPEKPVSAAMTEAEGAKRGAQGRRPAVTSPKRAMQIAGRVATEPDTAFFWSGRSRNAAGGLVGGAERAAEIAEARGGTTLETLIEEREISMPDWDPNNAAAVNAWRDLSAEYAAQASGEVRAVIGQELRPGSVWETIELPALMKNPNITKITAIDPATGASKVIFP